MRYTATSCRCDQSHVDSASGQAAVEFITIKLSAAKGEDEPGMREGTAEVPHQIAAAYRPEAASVFDAATALGTTLVMVDPQPMLMALLVRHVRLPRALLPQIEINSTLHVLVA
jgi:hypothetical protein